VRECWRTLVAQADQLVDQPRETTSLFRRKAWEECSRAKGAIWVIRITAGPDSARSRPCENQEDAPSVPTILPESRNTARVARIGVSRMVRTRRDK
jgi:hypothetical protein